MNRIISKKRKNFFDLNIDYFYECGIIILVESPAEKVDC